MKTAHLIVVRGAREGAQFPLGDEPTRIGRDREAEVFIDDEAASRQHASIVKRDGRFYLRDLGSTNGTYLGGVLHNTEVLLSDGDCFKIGECEFVFRDPTPDDARDTQALDPLVGDELDEERRMTHRLPSQVHFAYERSEGEGVVSDISATGVRVATQASRLRRDLVIQLLFSRGKKCAPFEARVRVTRATETEFAGEFVEVDEALGQLLGAPTKRRS
jgi:pSer/pThr/pTyr-binding forkhead associated (FHA) protein